MRSSPDPTNGSLVFNLGRRTPPEKRVKVLRKNNPSRGWARFVRGFWRLTDDFSFVEADFSAWRARSWSGTDTSWPALRLREWSDTCSILGGLYFVSGLLLFSAALTVMVARSLQRSVPAVVAAHS